MYRYDAQCGRCIRNRTTDSVTRSNDPATPDEITCCKICSGRSPSDCLCLRHEDPHHLPHFFCRATDQNNLAAQVAALNYKTEKSVLWLGRNLALIVFLSSDLFEPIGIFCSLVQIICFINVLYYISNIINLNVIKYRLKRDADKNASKNCLWEKNLPKDLVRYFEDSSLDFLIRYWDYFLQLVVSLRVVRKSQIGKQCTEVGMEKELKTIGEFLRQKQLTDWNRHFQMEDHKFQLNEKMVKYNRRCVSTERQLLEYWNDYVESTKDETVRSSKAYTPPRADLDCSTDQRWNDSPLSGDCVTETVFISPVISHLRYQLSLESNAFKKVPESKGTSMVEFFEFMKTYHKDDYCKAMYGWVANLKFWLSCKIKEVVEQFEMANGALRECGASNVQIGVSDTTTLHRALSSHERLHTFVPLLDFLTLTHEQSYLFWRYRVLGNSHCLRSYTWNSGGDPRGNWTPETGPSDSDIVLHFFSRYLDMKLPPLTSHPSSKRPFTDFHVILSQDRNPPSYTTLAIVRQWKSPPHYNVILGGQVHQMPGGSNNLLVALAYLLYCFKIYHAGRIGRISLDKHGLNLLWIVGDQT